MNTNATTTATIALRRLCCLASLLAACLLLALSLAPGAFAKGSYVLDDYGLYDSSTRQELEQSASQLASTYGVAPYLVVVDDIGSQTVRSFAESYWLDHELGIGSDASGIMFLIAVDSRDYVTITHGTGIYAFTDYGIEQLEDAVVSYLGDDEWEDAAECYYEQCSSILAFCADKGEPFDSHNDPAARVVALGMAFAIALLLALAVAFIVRRILKGQLKSVAAGSSAAGFLAGSVVLTAQQDVFTGSHVSVVPLPKNDDNGGGLGGSTVSASGFGGSAGGKF
ncbi:MAG: TPM domain-containing protein [Coriobacteriaceae bacterium]|nr:TPM domain-containing protein [Coriobacteriaceae bacterium]MDD6769081.1 TPM domain-containing protein [Coriobacteriaceae bacterium]